MIFLLLNIVMENHHVIYHWWHDDLKVKPYQNLEYPIVLAIASLRLHDKHSKVTVLDTSYCDRPLSDWDVFPEILDFKVVKWKPFIGDNFFKSSRMCSRIWDIWEYAKSIEEKNILFSDCDVFWFRNPYPLEGENKGKIQGVYCNGNCGFFYFDKTCKKTKDTFDLWKAIMCRVFLPDVEHFNEIVSIRSSTGPNFFHDESAFHYLIRRFPQFFNTIPEEEHGIFFPILSKKTTNHLMSFVKNIHFINQTSGKKEV